MKRDTCAKCERTTYRGMAIHVPVRKKAKKEQVPYVACKSEKWKGPKEVEEVVTTVRRERHKTEDGEYGPWVPGQSKTVTTVEIEPENSDQPKRIVQPIIKKEKRDSTRGGQQEDLEEETALLKGREPKEHGGKGQCGYKCILAHINERRWKEETMEDMNKKIAEWLKKKRMQDGRKPGQKMKKRRIKWKEERRS